MESTSELLNINKTKNDILSFFIPNKNAPLTYNYINDFFCQPKVPLIGHYDKEEYTFGKILGVINFDFKICQGEKKDKTESTYTDFHFPENLEEYLCVNEELSISNNTKASKKEAVFIPKDTISFYVLFSDLPEVNPKAKEIYNIVPHLYYLRNSDMNFSKTKRLVFEKPITLFDVENTPYDAQTDHTDREIDINNLRLEYSSVHFKKGALAFSPNNLQFKVNKAKELAQFYVIITDKDDKYHSVFYYITCNNQVSSKKMQALLEGCSTLDQVKVQIAKQFTDNPEVFQTMDAMFNLGK